MINDVVLRVEKLRKCFKIYASPWRRAVEWAMLGKRSYHQPFWALQDISFDIKRGEFFGIIGQNGAGKSTLLKILSGVLQPTSGTYQVNGRVLSMLELGMDFNPYLTGRNNVLRSTELLGFPDGYVQSRMAQIQEFSELGEFFDRPVRLYSTGMAARLAFSIYAFLDCDVLILDEVLAVGDLFFRQKCYARLEELIKKQTTIIFVTHAMDAVREYCQKVLLLHRGEMVFQGSAQEAIRRYHQAQHRHPESVKAFNSMERMPAEPTVSTKITLAWPDDEMLTPAPPAADEQPAQLTRFAICNEQGMPCVDFEHGDRLTFYGEFYINEPIGVPNIRIDLTNQFNTIIHAKSLLQSHVPLPSQVRAGTHLRIVRTLTLSLQTGEYVVTVALNALPSEDYARLDELPAQYNWRRQRLICEYPKLSYFKIHLKGGQYTHLGICDLPGSYQLEVIPPA